MTGVLDCPLIVGWERLSPVYRNERKRSTGGKMVYEKALGRSIGLDLRPELRCLLRWKVVLDGYGWLTRFGRSELVKAGRDGWK